MRACCRRRAGQALGVGTPARRAPGPRSYPGSRASGRPIAHRLAFASHGSVYRPNGAEARTATSTGQAIFQIGARSSLQGVQAIKPHQFRRNYSGILAATEGSPDLCSGRNIWVGCGARRMLPPSWTRRSADRCSLPRTWSDCEANRKCNLLDGTQALAAGVVRGAGIDVILHGSVNCTSAHGLLGGAPGTARLAARRQLWT